MDARFLPHNAHMDKPEAFMDLDPHLKLLGRQPLVHHSPLLEQIPHEIPGVFTLSGGRQIGKTTLLKQWMAKLLEIRIAPENIVYITGELIDDHYSLLRILGDLLKEMPDTDLSYILLDEVTYIKNWDKGIKYLADAGMLERIVLVITGSDLAIIKEARMRFPGRRGLSAKVDFHLYPLRFLEFLKLHGRLGAGEIELMLNPGNVPADKLVDRLFEEFESYLYHGGFLTAINDMAAYGHILPATFMTYSDWIRGDVLKRNKQEHYLLEILGAIIKRYGTQITWNALSRDLSIDHPKTVADYVALLVSMDAVFVQAALMEDKLTASPKKSRKVMFTDPFIFHAVNGWIHQSEDPFEEEVKPLLLDAEWSGKLIEACVTTHYARHFPTYYIKAGGEVDIAYVNERRFWPVEVKWTGQLRPKQLKQIGKYPNALILTRSRQAGSIHGTPTVPLPLALMRLDSQGKM
jgi:predicted AAA+ superfamily ATPase